MLADRIVHDRAAYAGFAVFGGFWGSWGASIPALRDQAGVSDGQLGTALIFVGAGALPAMLLAGRLVDRGGPRAAAVLLALLGVVGVLLALTARDLPSLSVGLAAVGATSGAADVAINTVAGTAQRARGRPVITRAHASFSAAVVVASLVTGALRALGAPPVAAFAVLAVAAGAVAATLVLGAGEQARPRPGPRLAHHRPPLAVRPLLVLGALGALAFAVENAHQTWSALYLRDFLHAGPVMAAGGPAVFAAVVAVTRLAVGSLSTRHPIALVVLGSGVAAAGTTLVGAAPSIRLGLLGLGIAAAGTAVLFPTLLGVVTDRVPDHVRGTATSIVTSVAYLGFLTGPVYVGRWADAVGLPGAMFALAAVAAILALLTPLALRRITGAGTDAAVRADARLALPSRTGG